MTTTENANHQTDRRIVKPISIQDYNNSKGLDDESDMQMSFSESVRKSLKWYKKFFFHLLDISPFNAYVLYKLQIGEKIALSDFRLEVVPRLWNNSVFKDGTAGADDRLRRLCA
jgi:hypothetical protein